MGDEEEACNGNGTECTSLKNEAGTNGFVNGIGNDGGECYSGGSDGFRTYKRRKHVKLRSDSKAREDGRVFLEAASQLAEQTQREPYSTFLHNSTSEQVFVPMNASDDCSQWHCRNVVLEHIYQSLSDDEGGIKRCIREALVSNHETNCTRTAQKSDHSDEGRRKSSQDGGMSNGSRKAANGDAGVISSGYSKESDRHTITAKCQRAFLNILISDKFTSLCKLLFENFQGFKADFFDFSIINTRMKEGAYERSPILFSSDIQQVWRKLQGVGSGMVSLSKSLSDLSRISYHHQVGELKKSTYKDGKHEFCPRESDSHAKPEQTEGCGVYGFCYCRHCGGKQDGRDCLICDSCEGLYHFNCIQPALKEIPLSFYCARCTAIEIGPHENCVVCERLNAPENLSNGGDEDISPTNVVTPMELEENSNCSTDDGLQQSKDRRNIYSCKICGSEVQDGEKMQICSHFFCPFKYYHARCLTSKQLKLYSRSWYCPSCLCRVCLIDQDDDKIILCDGCDDAFHLYCLDPPRTSVPRGAWFCGNCNAGIQAIRKAKRVYEKLEHRQKKKGEVGFRAFKNIEKKWNDTVEEGSEKGGGGMDMLLTAAKTLNYEENLASIHMGL